MRYSRNYYELYRVWKGWRDAVGKPAKDEYARKVEILNEIAEANGNVCSPVRLCRGRVKATYVAGLKSVTRMCV